MQCKPSYPNTGIKKQYVKPAGNKNKTKKKRHYSHTLLH